MRNRAAVAILCLLPLMGGCSLVFHGTTQQVEFTSEPSDADFTIDGQKVKTPVTLTLPRKDQRLIFTKEGCHDAVVELKTRPCTLFYFSLIFGLAAGGIDIATGAWLEFEKDQVHVLLRPKPGTSVDREVNVTSDPPGASIHIDGLSYGSTPGKFKLRWDASAPQKEVVLKLAGYEDLRLPLRWDSPTADAKLVALPESILSKFDSDPAGAEVWVDGKLLGTTPRSEKYDWHAASPARSVEFRMAGYVTETKTLTKSAPLVAARLKEAVETLPLKLEIEPADAMVEVDGGPAGPAPAEIPLEWSVKTRKRHELKFIRAGYRSEEVVVDADRKGEPVRIRLRPLLPRMP